MRMWTAIFLSVPVALGLVAWAVRPTKAPRSMTIAKPVDVVSEPEQESFDKVPLPEMAEDDRAHREVAREKARERLVADYELRIRHLIASIDWTSPESRVRFPVEHDMIQAEFDRAVEWLQE